MARFPATGETVWINDVKNEKTRAKNACMYLFFNEKYLREKTLGIVYL